MPADLQGPQIQRCSPEFSFPLSKLHTFWQNLFQLVWGFICFSKTSYENYWLQSRRQFHKLVGGIECVCASSVTKLGSTLHHPTDCSPPGSSVRGVLQARILKWVAISISRGSSQPRDQTHVSGFSFTAGRFFTMSHQGSPYISICT